MKRNKVRGPNINKQTMWKSLETGTICRHPVTQDYTIVNGVFGEKRLVILSSGDHYDTDFLVDIVPSGTTITITTD